MVGELYTGVKFSALKIRNERHISKKDLELLKWCKKFAAFGFAPSYGRGSSGNLSYRTKKGFVITPTASYFDKVSTSDFCEIVKVDICKKRVFFKGRNTPSSESLLHYLVYTERQDIIAVFHGHGDIFLKNEHNFVSTEREFPYGSVELAKVASVAVKKSDFIILKNHGFLCVGKSIEKCGSVAEKNYYSLLIKK
ncbi:MAG: class II aldolase/adducin family protein [archaeon]